MRSSTAVMLAIGSSCPTASRCSSAIRRGMGVIVPKLLSVKVGRSLHANLTREATMLRQVGLVFAMLSALFASIHGQAQPLPIIGNHPLFGPICAGPLGPGPCADVARYLAMQQQGMPPPGMQPGPAGPGLPPQLLQIGFVPGVGPICAGPLGPGPCAAVQQYLMSMAANAPPLQVISPQDLRVVNNLPGVGPVCNGPRGAVPCAQVQQQRLDSFSGPLPSQASFGVPVGLSPVQLAQQCAAKVGLDATLFAACTGRQAVLPDNLHKVVDCAVESRQTEDFAKCAAGPLGIRLSTDQQTAVTCAVDSSGDRDDFIDCAGAAFLDKNLNKDQRKVLECASDADGDSRAFTRCASRALGRHLSEDQRTAVNCAVESKGDEGDFITCAGSALLNQKLSREQRKVLDCAASSNGESGNFVGCAAPALLGRNASREQRVAMQCAAESGGQVDSFAACAGANMLNLQLNPEQQIAVQCVVSTGGQPYAAAGCMATRLTARELLKCASNGIGGKDGCFGDSNDLVGKNGWVARTFGQIAGGPNSVINNPGQIWGGDNSFVRNPGQIWGGNNSFVRNPSQIWGGPNSVFNNPGQLLPSPKPLTLGSVGGKRICLPWC
jgi:hypothetical protein